MEHYSIGVDIWALGCIFAELFLNGHLFKKSDKFEMLWEIFKMLGNPDFSKWTHMGAGMMGMFPKFRPQGLDFIADYNDSFDSCAKDLLTRMLSVDYWRRPTCRQILEHPFLSRP